MIAFQLIFGIVTVLFLFIIYRKVHCTMLTQTELVAKLDALSDQSDKAKAEILAEIQTLKDQLGQVSPEVEASLNRLTQKTQALDDLNTDTETPAPPAA